MLMIQHLISRLRREEEGATMVEYAIMVALIAIVSILVVTALGTETAEVFDTAQGHMQNVSGVQPTQVGGAAP